MDDSGSDSGPGDMDYSESPTLISSSESSSESDSEPQKSKKSKKSRKVVKPKNDKKSSSSSKATKPKSNKKSNEIMSNDSENGEIPSDSSNGDTNESDSGNKRGPEARKDRKLQARQAKKTVEDYKSKDRDQCIKDLVKKYISYRCIEPEYNLQRN